MNNIILKIIFLPVSVLYGTVVGLRNFCYRIGLLRSSSFDIPVINVGNLSVGGTGKTPHIEYLIDLLKPYIDVATLSRGYGRRTEGFRMVEVNSTAEEVGDEPLQFKRKRPFLPVAVGENRSFAIPQLLQFHPEIRTILLDDAFQHLAVKPYLNILLTEYSHPFMRDFILPTGRLREWQSGYQRADIIVVTKCPDGMTVSAKEKWGLDIRLFPHQRLYFSKFIYGTPYSLFNPNYQEALTLKTDVLLLCAIAKTDYLLGYLKTVVRSVRTLEFDDHRFFTNYDIAQAKREFDGMDSKQKVIITTEKDMVRLDPHYSFLTEHQLPVYVLPIEVGFLFDEGRGFDEDVKGTLLEFKI